MVTSSIPSEGKTTQSLALAMNFASLGRKTLLIECDIRRRVFAEYFSMAGQHSILSVMTNEVLLKDAVEYVPSLGCDVLAAGRAEMNAADLFSQPGLAELIQEARALYDVVVIDTPPVLVVPDARVIGVKADAVLYVVKWDATTVAQVRNGMKMLESANASITGMVLSQVDPAGMRRYGYGERYGAYASYGANYYE